MSKRSSELPQYQKQDKMINITISPEEQQFQPKFNEKLLMDESGTFEQFKVPNYGQTELNSPNVIRTDPVERALT